MQFLNLITFICFRLQNYTNFSIIYYLLFLKSATIIQYTIKGRFMSR